MPSIVESDERWLYRVGGVSAIVLGLGYLAIFPLFAKVGAPPATGEGWLNYLAGKTAVWWAILGLSVFTDFLFVPVALSLYAALKHVSRSAMLLATAFMGLFVVLDLAVTWTNYAALLTLSALHSAASTEAQRASYVSAANYASAILASRVEVFYAIVDLSLGILTVSFVMLKAKGAFGRATAYVGLATGISGLVSITGFFPAILTNALLATAWLFLVGYRLIRLARH